MGNVVSKVMAVFRRKALRQETKRIEAEEVRRFRAMGVCPGCRHAGDDYDPHPADCPEVGA